MKVKLEIVSGFLGSGKSSFINAYLNTEVCLKKEILIILLENGVTPIRSGLENIKEIYIEDIDNLKKTLLKETIKKNYSKVIIEFNGTSNLGIIGEIFKDKEIRKNINFYGSYYIGDGKNLKIYLKNLGEVIIPFIQSSKLIILNNIVALSKKDQKELINYIENINITAPILVSKSLESLEEEMKESKYFKEGVSIEKIKSLLNIKEVVR